MKIIPSKKAVNEIKPGKIYIIMNRPFNDNNVSVKYIFIPLERIKIIKNKIRLSGYFIDVYTSYITKLNNAAEIMRSANQAFVKDIIKLIYKKPKSFLFEKSEIELFIEPGVTKIGKQEILKNFFAIWS